MAEEQNKVILKEEGNPPEQEKSSQTQPPPTQFFASGMNVFDDPKYREKVESRLPKINVEELLFTGKVTQTVPISNKLVVTFTTLEAGVDVLIDRIAYEASNRGESYAKVSALAALAASLVNINGQPFLNEPRIEYDGTEATEEKYLAQLKKALMKVKAMNVSIIMLLCNHAAWFNERVNKFIKTDLLEEVENF